MNVIDIPAMLGKLAVSIGQMRDFGIGVDAYTRHFSTRSDSAEVRREHTLIAYWLPGREGLLSSHSTTDARIAKALKGLPVSGPYLKYCSTCASEELKRHGFATWHLTHQLPFSEVCTRHFDRLQRRFFVGEFCLPSDEHSLLKPEPNRSPQLKALAVAGKIVFKVSTKSSLRRLLINSLRVRLGCGNVRRLEILALGDTLRQLNRADPQFGKVLSDRGIEDGLIDFFESPLNEVDNLLLTLVLANEILIRVRLVEARIGAD